MADNGADLSDLIDRWVTSAIITADQAAAMRADVASRGLAGERADRSAQDPIVAEGLGYLGGAIILVGLVLAVGQFWDDLPGAARLALGAAVTVLLVGAGAVVPASLGLAGTRLRSVLWLASAGSCAVFLGLLAQDGFGWDDDWVVLFAAAGTALLAGALWRQHPQVFQHTAFVVALAVTAGAVAAVIPGGDADLIPLAPAWALGVLWFTLAARRVVTPRREGQVLGAVVACIASVFLANTQWGTPIAVATVLGLTLLAMRLRDLVLLAIAAAATLLVVPITVGQYFPGVLTVAFALLAVGALMIVAAVATIRRRRVSPPGSTAGSA